MYYSKKKEKKFGKYGNFVLSTARFSDLFNQTTGRNSMLQVSISGRYLEELSPSRLGNLI